MRLSNPSSPSTLGIEILPEDPTIMEEGDEEKRGITYKIMKNKVF